VSDLPLEQVKRQVAGRKGRAAPQPSRNGYSPKPATTAAATVVSRGFDEVERRSVEWLGPGFVPRGLLVVLDGNPGLGKSNLCVDLAARVSRGWDMPPGPGKKTTEPAGVAFLAAEDPAEQVIRPRLEAAGADLSRCRVLDGLQVGDKVRPLILPDDVLAIEETITRYGIRLMFIDPLLAYLNAFIDSHKDASVRQALGELTALANRTGTAIVALRHLNKSGGGQAVFRGGGSIAIGAAARSVLFAGRRPTEPDVNVLAVAKCNLCKTPPAQKYQVVDAGGDPRVDWTGPCDLTADELTAPTERPSRDAKRTAAAAWLKDILTAGPLTADEVLAKAERAGFTAGTVKRAKGAARVHAFKRGFSGPWLWGVGEPPKGSTEEAQLRPFE
jgi:hypothetical protein